MNRSFPIPLLPFLRGTAIRRGALFGGILVAALLAFEVFNYSTTEFALNDILGNLRFAGLTGRPSFLLRSAGSTLPVLPASLPLKKDATNLPKSGTCSEPGCWLQQ